MIYSDERAQEIFWIRRRLLFLESADEVVKSGGDSRDAEELGTYFKKVETVQDLVERLKEIYGDDLK